MGDQLNATETNASEIDAGGAVDVPKAAINGDTTNKLEMNGDSIHRATHGGTSSLGTVVKSEPTADRSSVADAKPSRVDGPSDANPDKPISTAEDNPAGMLPSDPKDEEAVSGGAALGEDTAGLGSILKGSPFEQDRGKKASPPKSSKAKAAVSHTSPTKSKTKLSMNGLANGKPKEVPASKPAAQSNSKTVNPAASAQRKEATGSTLSSNSIPSDSQSKTSVPPATLATASAGPPVVPSNDGTAEKKPEKKDPQEPRTPTDATASINQHSPKKTSPHLAKSKELRKEAAKGIKRPAGRPSTVAKPPPAAAAKPNPASSTSHAKPVKKSNPTSPKPGLNKPRPKSPTRPARLPAAATAPTAASSAKLDGAPPSTSDRKPNNFLPMRDRVPSNPTKAPPKPARTSLPAGSKPAEKPKGPRPRQSMASSKAPEGSFLDRMMRPTQSSSQKTHDKMEAKTPPKKQQQHVTRPKRISEGSDKSKTDRAEGKAETAKEPAASTDRTAVELSGIRGMNGASVSVSAAAHTTPPTIPVP